MTTISSRLAAELARQRTAFEAMKRLGDHHRKLNGPDYDPQVPIEASVVAHFVMPMLAALEWSLLSTEGTVERYAELKARAMQADAAVLDPTGHPYILVEAKRPGFTAADGELSQAEKHQLFGYAYEASRLQAPLAAVALTNGAWWWAWRVDRRSGRIVEEGDGPIRVSAAQPEDSAWAAFETLLCRTAVVERFATPSGSTEVAWPSRTGVVHASDLLEVMPKLYQAGEQVVAAVANRPIDHEALAREYPAIAKASWEAKRCTLCKREMRLDHRCDGALIDTWAWRLPH